MTDIRGYQLSRLALPAPPLYDMKLVLEERVPSTTETFYRQDLGIPYSSEESRLTPEVLEQFVEDYVIPRPLRYCVMGVDVGKRLHVVIRGRLNGKWFLLKAFTVSTFEELEPFFEKSAKSEIGCCVIDARPETRAARAFQQRHRDVVWLAEYVQYGIKPEWNWKEGVVKAPRPVIIDEMIHRFRSGVFRVRSD